MTDYREIQIWVDVAQFIVTGAVLFYLHLVKKNAATEERIQQAETGIERRLDEHGTRLATVEAHIEHAIGHKDLEKVYKEIASTRQLVENMSGRMTQIAEQVGRINQHLLDK